ncbi:MAG: c-type cytochrome [Terriglobia bacterium]
MTFPDFLTPDKILRAAAFLFVVALAVAVGGTTLGVAQEPSEQEEEEQEQQSQQAEPEGEQAPAPVAPLVIPEEEKKRKNPLPRTPEAIEMGKLLFTSQCWMCHGKQGDGTGFLGKDMGFKVLDFTDPEALKKRTDGEFHYILVHGHGGMPGQGERLQPKQKWSLIHYIRTLPAAKKKRAGGKKE